MQTTEPVFIIGNPRAGTTLLRLMLTRHSRIHIPPECGFAVWLQGTFGDWNGTDCENRLDAFLADLAASRKFETWELPAATLRAFLSDRRPAGYSDLVSAVYDYHAAAHGKAGCRWGDKNNFHLHHIPDIRALFPDVRFIHIARDPRDVACSYRELNRRQMHSPYQPNLPDDISEIATQWAQNIRTIRNAFDGFQWEHVFEIRFDDLVRQSEKTLSAACQFLGEDFEPAMLRYYESNRRRSLEPKEFLLWKEKTLEPPRIDRAERYRKELTDDEIRAVSGMAGEEMRLYGYT